MLAYRPKQLNIKILQSTFIEYPEEWKDKTGPFGGARDWGLDNLDEGDEVVGVKKKENYHGRIEIYRFKLIKGTNDYLKGRMEYPKGRHYLLDHGLLQLVELNNRVSNEWIALDKGDGKTIWHHTLGTKTERFESPLFAPMDPYVAIRELVREIENRNETEIDWCQAVFGCKAKLIHKQHYRLIFDPNNLENIQNTYNECIDLILAEGVTSENIDELIDIGLDLINPINPDLIGDISDLESENEYEE